REDSGRRIEPVAGNGPYQLAFGRVRAAFDWLSDDQAGERLGAKKVQGVGTRQYPRRAVAFRQGLVARTIQRAHAGAAGLAVDRLPEVMDSGHAGTDHRRSHSRADPLRSRL